MLSNSLPLLLLCYFYSTTRNVSKTNARINTARMLEIVSMEIETIGRRSLTGSATSSGKTGCAAFIAYMYFRNFRKKTS